MKKCIGPCGRPLRPNRTKVSEYPGTVLPDKGGRCQSCAKSKTAKSVAEIRPTTEQLASELAHYLQWRKPFRAKAGIL